MHLKNNMLSGFSVRLSEDFAKIVCTNTIIPEVYKNCKLRQDLLIYYMKITLRHLTRRLLGSSRNRHVWQYL